MSIVSATPRTDSDGNTVTQFTAAVDSTTSTYSYTTTQDNITIWNKGYKTLTINVGDVDEFEVESLESYEIDVIFDSFTIASDDGICEVQITTREYDNVLVKKEDLDAIDSQLAVITNNGTAKPIVPLLTATYEGDSATYDAQDVIWALHNDPIV